MNTVHRKAGLTLVGVLVLATACGDSGQEGIEQLIEQQSGGSVDVEFGDDGGISVQSEDGSFSIDEEGNFVVVDENGEVITGDIDANGDSINIESDQGNVVVDGDGGNVQISGDEGDVSFQTGSDIPADWPSAVPVPDGLTVVSSATFDEGGGRLTFSVQGVPATDAAGFVADYGAALEAAGFDRSSFFESPSGVSATWETGSWMVSLIGGDDGSGSDAMTVVVSAVV